MSSMTREEILTAINEGKSLRGANLSRANLSGANLSRANLRGADLSEANLYGANLSGADLRCANLSGADLSRANLSGADLSRADLRWANLGRSNLSRANLSGANLSEADLSEANLSEANLYGADLGGADLRCANLGRSNLSGADLRCANLSGANLSGANLSRAKNIPPIAAAQSLVTPEVGPFHIWKKLRGGHIAHLSVPSEAKRSSATTRKCRVSEATVLMIYGKDGTPLAEDAEVGSLHDTTFTYRVGKTVIPTEAFGEDRWVECAAGIHGFITRVEAEEYF